MFIYKITNQLDGKFYIGQTVNEISYRFRKHLELGERGGGYKLHSAISKHGRDNFSVELIEECSDLDELNQREIYWIDELRPHYNLCPGGSFRLGPESIEKMRKSLTGRKQSAESVAKRFSKIRDLEKDPEFLKERGRKISEGKTKTYVVEGVSYRGIQEVADAYGITKACAGKRLRTGYKNWGPVLK